MPFNSAQQQAIVHKDGPCLVLAGPGSGKTTVIIERVNRLIEEGVPPEKILTITFTKAAADEMQNRFLSRCKQETTRARFGTFHSVFFSILRYSSRSLQSVNVMTEGEKIRLIEEIFREKFREVEADSDLLQSLLTEMSNIRNSGKAELPSDGKTADKKSREKNAASNAAEKVDLSFLLKEYDARKRRNRSIDFDDMLFMTKELLETDPEALSFWRDQFSYIQVDEFQDINPAQYDIVRLLAGERANLLIVGDDDQSIYRFRGASPGIMLNFPKDYPRAKQITLGINYRSGKDIVGASVRLIGHNKERFRKRLSAESRERGSISVRRFHNETEECEELAREIERMMENGKRPEEIAVLTRTNHGAATAVSALTKAGIPFQARDRVPNVYRHFLCKPVFACFNWIRGNHTRANFLKFMNCPNRYFRREDLISELLDLERLKVRYREMPGREWMAERLEFFMYQLDMLSKIGSPYAMINFFRRYMDYDSYVREYAAQHKMEEAELFGALDEFQEEARPFGNTDEWYGHIARVTQELEEQKGKKEKRGRVNICTLHGSKGLEFETVYILNVNEKTIPHEKSLTKEAVEEERRLFYVGMTRAKKDLHLYSVEEIYGKKTEVSRFLKEI